MTDELEAQIREAEEWGNTDREAALRNRFVAENLPSGLLLERGKGRALIRHTARLRQLTHDSALYASLSIDLGYLFHCVDHGDPRANTERGIQYVNDALEVLDREKNSETWARACTTLGMLYNERETDEEQHNYETAEKYLRAALEVRPRERSAINWAYTASNLAETLRRSANGFEYSQALDRLDESYALHNEAAEVFETSRDLTSIALQTRVNSGVALLERVTISIQARQRRLVSDHGLIDLLVEVSGDQSASDTQIMSPEALVVQMADLANLNPGVFGASATPDWARIVINGSRPNEEEIVNLQRVEQIGRAIAARDDSGEVKARALKLAADAIDLRSEDDTDVVDLYQGALDEFGSIHDPSFLAEIGMKAGSGWSARDEWSRADIAFRVTLDAINELYTAKRSAFDQEVELARFPKLIELSAYASARCGDLATAVRTLEHGRARELTRALYRSEPDLQQLQSVAPGVVSQFQQLLPALRLGSPDAESEADKLLAAARRRSKFDYLGLRASDQDICTASTPERPLVYLVSTPSGTASLCVLPDENELHVELIQDSFVTSAELVLSQYRLDVQERRAVGMLTRDSETLGETLTSVADRLGDTFAVRLRQYFEYTEVDSVVIVAAGVLGALPLSAASTGTDENGRTRRLVESFAITLTPTASVFLSLQRRASRSPDTHRRLLAVGDAERNIASQRLKYAEPEIDGISSQFENATLLVGEQATVAAVLSLTSSATLLHFACHGYTDAVDPWSSRISLADGPLYARDIYASMRVSARIVILSACESGRYGVGLSDANQAIGLSSAVLRAGASTVVSSLAQVNDLATFALMLRFHERLREVSDRKDAPARALRDSQLWLSQSTYSDIENLTRRSVDIQTGSIGRGIVSWLSSLKNKAGNVMSPAFGVEHWAQFNAVGY